MKKELEKIMAKYNGFTDSNYKTQYLPTSLCNMIVADILNLFNKTIEESKGEIKKYLYKKFDIAYTDLDFAQDIINIIKNEIGKDK